MSCNTFIPLTDLAGEVADILGQDYVLKDDPRITDGVFTRPTIKGDIILDAAARNVFCEIVQQCGGVYIPRPLAPDTIPVSYVDGGEIKVKWVSNVNSNAADVEVSPQIAGQVTRNQQMVNRDRQNVKDWGAKGDLVTDDSAAFQANAAYMDAERVATMFVPSFENEYLLNTTFGIKYPAGVMGDRPATYQRGAKKKKGNIVVGDTMLGLDLGMGATRAEREGNDADQWTVQNVSFVIKEGTTYGTKTAISHTANTNGPDRGLIFVAVSAHGFKNAIHLKNNGAQTQGATLVVEKCCLSSNSKAVNAEGNVFGARFVGNQMEWCSEGAIHGVFHGPLTIHDNMLEGGGNPVYVKDLPADRNGCALSLERNYFEGVYGDYVVKMESFSGNSIVSRGNYVSGMLAADGITPSTTNNQPRDHFLLTNLYDSIYIHDRLAVSFFGFCNVRGDNNLDNFFVYAKPGPQISLTHPHSGTTRVAASSSNPFAYSRRVATQLGELFYIEKFGVAARLGVVSAPNAVLEIVISYVSTSAESSIAYVNIGEVGGVRISDGGVPVVSKAREGEVVTVTIIFTVPDTATGKALDIVVFAGGGGSNATTYIVGLAATILGTYTSTGTGVANRFLTYKKNPKIQRVADGLILTNSIPATTVTQGVPYTTTFVAYGVLPGDRVEAEYMFTNVATGVTKTLVAAQDSLVLTLTNTSETPFVVVAGDKVKSTVRR